MGKSTGQRSKGRSLEERNTFDRGGPLLSRVGDVMASRVIGEHVMDLNLFRRRKANYYTHGMAFGSALEVSGRYLC